jgi:hypothetical protein
MSEQLQRRLRNMQPYQCSICKREGWWSESWSWDGSFRDLNKDNLISTVCSDKCREALNAG